MSPRVVTRFMLPLYDAVDAHAVALVDLYEVVRGVADAQRADVEIPDAVEHEDVWTPLVVEARDLASVMTPL